MPPVLPDARAAWYDDPCLPGQQPYWDGERWTNHSVARHPGALGRQQSRSKAVRLVITISLWIGIYVIALLVASPFALAATTARGESEAASAIVLFLLLGTYGWLGRKVSYRWFDCFFLIIPIYGLIWSLTILWRISNLPHRDWRPRPEEVALQPPLFGG